MRPAFLAVLLAASLGACTGPPRLATRADYEARLERNPRDGEAARELGAALAREGQTAAARDALELAAAIDPLDGKALYLLGLTTEALGQDAEQIYARYGQIPAGDAYADSLRARLDGIVRARLQAEFSRSLADESTIADVSGTSAVAVLPFAYRGQDADYAPLGRGLAEVLSVDLASISGLMVVERARLEALLAEFELARQGHLDPATAPVAGRLLRADRLVGGEYDVRGDAGSQTLRIDAAVFQDAAAGGDPLTLDAAEGGLADLFRLQNDVTRTVLVALGIAVSAEDQARLGAAPTDDLTAFLLFSRGLLDEDRGDFEGAARLYADAARRDPGFALAATRRDEARFLLGTAGPAPAVLLTAAAPALPDGLDLVGQRVDQMSADLRARLGPNSESREAVVEGSGAGLLGPLPDPPDPPTAGGN